MKRSVVRRRPSKKRVSVKKKKRVVIKKKKVDLYKQNLTDILTKYIDTKQILTILEYKLKDGTHIFDSKYSDLNFQLISILKQDKKKFMSLIKQKWDNAKDMYFSLDLFTQARNEHIRRENGYFNLAEMVESGIQCENPKCLSYNIRITDVGPTSGDEAGRSTYECTQCNWSRKA